MNVGIYNVQAIQEAENNIANMEILWQCRLYSSGIYYAFQRCLSCEDTFYIIPYTSKHCTDGVAIWCYLIHPKLIISMAGVEAALIYVQRQDG